MKAAPEWPPRRDRSLWCWILAAHALPLLAWASGSPFWWNVPGAEGYVPTPAWAWLLPQAAVALFLQVGPAWLFRLCTALAAIQGMLLIATLLQAPEAFEITGVLGLGLEFETYLGLARSYTLAITTGVALTGIAAQTLGLDLQRKSGTGHE